MKPTSAPRPTPFVPLPAHPRLILAWPTPNQHLFHAPRRFFAHTRANPEYGRPGWTRDCGRRLHLGCDVAPVDATPTGQSTTVQFTNCATGQEYPSQEPTWIPHDPVFCSFDGVVEEAINDPTTSDFGIHAVMRHTWPASGNTFYSLYAHLAHLDVTPGQRVPTGHRLGIMGTSSRIPDARNWMSIAPHLHIEFWDTFKKPFNPELFLLNHLVFTPPHPPPPPPPPHQT